MNRENWITVLIDGTVDDMEIYTFLDMSFNNVGRRMAAKRGDEQ